MSRVKPEQVASSATGTDRLDGWKEIAAHLRRSVRTVQRWERELALPVRRMGSSGSEVVYAFRREIDEWLLSRPPASGAGDDAPRTTEEPGPTRRPLRGRLAWAGALVVAAIGVAWVWSASSGANRRNGLEAGPEPHAAGRAATLAGPERQPARWEVADGGLAVLDYAGERVCTIAFDAPVELAVYEDSPPRSRVAADLSSGEASLTSKPLVQITDIDGDGRREVVVAQQTIDLRQRSLAVYDASCRLRWKDTSQPSAVFGDVLYDGPYHVLWVRVTKSEDGRWVIWSSRRHSKYFPSVLQKFDAEGRLLGQFWNSGEVTEFATGHLAGRDSVVIGGVNNEFRQPFVARFDADASVGVGPATSARYRCSSCPAGAVAPRAYVLFPNSELGALVVGTPAVTAIRLDHQWVAVEIQQYTLSGVPQPVIASASYDLDANLVPVRADLSDGYKRAWQYLFDRGIVRRPFDPRERDRLWDVRAWDGSRFRVMPPSRQAAR